MAICSAAARGPKRNSCSCPVAERREVSRDPRRTARRPSLTPRTSLSTSSRSRAIQARGLCSPRSSTDRLYFRNKDQKVFLIKTGEQDAPKFDLIDPITLKARRFRVRPTTSQRSERTTICGASCRRRWHATDCRARMLRCDLESVQDIERDLNPENVQLLRDRSAVETDSAK